MIWFFNSFILVQKVTITGDAENRLLTKEEDGFLHFGFDF